MYVFTIATHDKGYLGSLKDSCEKNNLDLHVIGFGEPWEGFQTKLKLIQQTLDTLSDDTICLFTDAYPRLSGGRDHGLG